MSTRTIYDDTAAWHIVQPYYDMLRATVPAAEAGAPFAEAFQARIRQAQQKGNLGNTYSSEWRWDLCADMLDDMRSLAESYGVTPPMRWLAADWLIECQTVTDAEAST